jgi:hypothetical protein
MSPIPILELSLILRHALRVKIPYANKIKFATSGNLRNTQRLLDMIKGYAVMFHMQREKDTDGSILANREDFKMASALFNTQIESAVTKLTDEKRRVTKYITDHGHCTINEIVKGTKYPYSKVRNLLKGHNGSVSRGLLEKVPELSEERETHTEKTDEFNSISKTCDYYTISINSNTDAWAVYSNVFAEIEE